MKTQKDCGRSTFFNILGWVLMVIGLVAIVFIPISGFHVSVMVGSVLLIGTALNCFMFSFITQLIFECRNCLVNTADSKGDIAC
jgi:uncharacterized membrane protein HdeD (DUF308 family)